MMTFAKMHTNSHALKNFLEVVIRASASRCVARVIQKTASEQQASWMAESSARSPVMQYLKEGPRLEAVKRMKIRQP